MNVARLLYPVRVLGPGNRIGIWLCGCTRRCKGCSNPELWEPRREFELSVDAVESLVRRVSAAHPVDGFTISGGEPMDQADAMAELLCRLGDISDDVLLYSGYRLETLRERRDPATNRILQIASVLIDGAYVEEKHDGALLRGSSNQRIHILNSKYAQRYRRYFAQAHNQIQNFTTTDGIVSVGIHPRGFRK